MYALDTGGNDPQLCLQVCAQLRCPSSKATRNRNGVRCNSKIEEMQLDLHQIQGDQEKGLEAEDVCSNVYAP